MSDDTTKLQPLPKISDENAAIGGTSSRDLAENISRIGQAARTSGEQFEQALSKSLADNANPSADNVPDFLKKGRATKPNGKPRRVEGMKTGTLLSDGMTPQGDSKPQAPSSPPSPTLGQAILDGTIDAGRTVLINEVTHLRETLAKRWPVIGWFRRFVLTVIGVPDPTAVLNELGTMREHGTLALNSLGQAVEDLKFQLIETEQSNTQVCDAVDAFVQRDALAQHNSELKKAAAEQQAAHDKDRQSWRQSYDQLRDQFREEVAKAEHAHQERIKALNEKLEFEIDQRHRTDQRADLLETNLRRIAESALLLDLEAAFVAARSNTGGPKKIQNALDKLKSLHAEIERLVTTDPFIVEDDAETEG